MRILHVTNTYLPVRNGVTVSVAGWVAALAEQGHEVAVWTIAHEGQPGQGIHVTRGVGQLAHGFPVPVGRMPAAIRDTAWDVVHAHHPVLLGPRARTLARRCGAVLAATVHSDYVAYTDSYASAIASIARPVVRERMRRFFEATDVVFVPSAGIAASVESWGVDRGLVPITYPVDHCAFGALTREEARVRLGIDPTTPLAVYAGRLAADKRVERLVAEFGLAREAVGDAVLGIVGGGPVAARIAELAAPMGGAVRLTGELAPHEVAVWYAAADVFVSASPNEVGPLALIEAGLCGTAAVAYDVPGFRDRIVDGESGVLASSAPGELGRALAVMLADLDRAHAMGRRAAECFSSQRPGDSALSLVSAYASAGAGGSGSGRS